MKETGDSRYVIKNAINSLVFKILFYFFMEEGEIFEEYMLIC